MELRWWCTPSWSWERAQVSRVKLPHFFNMRSCLSKGKQSILKSVILSSEYHNIKYQPANAWFCVGFTYLVVIYWICYVYIYIYIYICHIWLCLKKSESRSQRSTISSPSRRVSLPSSDWPGRRPKQISENQETNGFRSCEQWRFYPPIMEIHGDLWKRNHVRSTFCVPEGCNFSTWIQLTAPKRFKAANAMAFRRQPWQPNSLRPVIKAVAWGHGSITTGYD